MGLAAHWLAQGIASRASCSVEPWAPRSRGTLAGAGHCEPSELFCGAVGTKFSRFNATYARVYTCKTTLDVGKHSFSQRVANGYQETASKVNVFKNETDEYLMRGRCERTTD